MSKIGIIGGSGLYDMEGFEDREDLSLNTPFGSPSGNYVTGRLEKREVVFLPRHGAGHTLLPSEINYRANIYGFKKLGVDRLISVCAVGSLKEEYKPLDAVLPDQFFDRTKGSGSQTFFGEGVVAHVSLADPVCAGLMNQIKQASLDTGATVHAGGTYVNMEGPAFSTRAESNFYRSMGFDVIGMTAQAEAKLAREAEICFAVLATVTDYDCWHTGENVSAEMILKNLTKNIDTSKKILRRALKIISGENTCPCTRSLANAIVTRPKAMGRTALKRLDIIIGKYLSI